MFGKVSCLGFVILSMAFCGVVQGIPIAVENHSFELPGGGVNDYAMTHPTNGQQVPGWIGQDKYGNPTTESGVQMIEKTGLPHLDGIYNAYCGNHKNIANRPSSFYQDLAYAIKAGEIYTLTFWGNTPYSGSAWPQGVLYYRNTAGAMVELAASAYTAPYRRWEEISVSFEAVAGQAYVGQPLGIRFRTGGGEHYVHFDNVSVDMIPEPATLGLLILGGLSFLRRKRAY